MKKISSFKSLLSLKKGFTLIELLIVIAVLGVLAAVVLVAIDPAQQLARGRDSGRKTSIGQLGRALQAYYTVTAGSVYPTDGQWAAAGDNILVSSGEIKTFPANPTYSVGGAICTTNKYPTGAGVNGFCYDQEPVPPPSGPSEAVVFAQLESKSEINKCGVGIATWFVWSSSAGRAGGTCGSVPIPGFTGPFAF